MKTEARNPGTSIWCSDVLLDDDWAKDVLLHLDDNGLISHCVPGCDVSDLPDATEQLRGYCVPGVANLHSHAHQRAITGLGEQGAGGDSFWTWREAMYRTVARIEPDQLYDVARMLYLEMLEAGYTRVGEFQYLHHDRAGKPYANRAEMTLQCARAAADVGIGFTALPVLYRYAGFGEQSPGDGQKRFINDAEGFLEIVSILDRQLDAGDSCGIAPHSLRATSPALLARVLSAVDADRPVHIHIAEQTKEVDDCLAWCGQRPVQWLLDHFKVDPRWVLIHATHMDENETVTTAASGAVAGLCLTTEANLGDGFFNAIQYFELGGAWGIGSDSHISVSVTEELRWLEYGQRLLLRGRNLLGGAGIHTGASLLHQATAGGAQALGRGNGKLVVGQPADIVVLDPAHPRLLGRSGSTALDSWVFSAAGNAVKDVVVGGRRVLDNGQHVAREEICQRFGQTVQELAE